MHWQPVPEANVALLARLMSAYADATPRKLFGCPVFFIDGKLCIGAHEAHLLLRLSVEDQQELLQHPEVTHFAPMAGRPMREYLQLPPSLYADEVVLRAWIDRSVAYVRTLPPPVQKPRRRKC